MATQSSSFHVPDIDSAHGDFTAYVARPAVLPAPAIVVLQEIFGVNADMRQTADELAQQGFIAICPDLFWRLSPNIELSAKTDWDQGFKLHDAYDRGQGMLDITATIDTVRVMAGCSGKVGVMGFCLGGLMTCLTAARRIFPDIFNRIFAPRRSDQLLDAAPLDFGGVSGIRRPSA